MINIIKNEIYCDVCGKKVENKNTYALDLNEALIIKMCEDCLKELREAVNKVKITNELFIVDVWDNVRDGWVSYIKHYTSLPDAKKIYYEALRLGKIARIIGKDGTVVRDGMIEVESVDKIER